MKKQKLKTYTIHFAGEHTLEAKDEDDAFKKLPLRFNEWDDFQVTDVLEEEECDDSNISH